MAQGDFPGTYITPDTERPFETLAGAESSTQVDIWKKDGAFSNLFNTTVTLPELNDSIVNNPMYANLTLTNQKTGLVNKTKMRTRRGGTGVPHDDLYPVNATPLNSGSKIAITKFGDIDVWNMEEYSTMQEVLDNSEPVLMRRGLIQSIDDMVLFGINKIGYSEYEGQLTLPQTISDVATIDAAATVDTLIDALTTVPNPVLVVQNEAALVRLQLQAAKGSTNSATSDVLGTLISGIRVAYYRDLNEVMKANEVEMPTDMIPFVVYSGSELDTVFNPEVELLFSQDATLENAQLNGGAEQVVSLFQRGKFAWRVTAFGGYQYNGDETTAITNIDMGSTPSNAD